METSARMSEERLTLMEKCITDIHKSEVIIINDYSDRLLSVKTFKGHIRNL